MKSKLFNALLSTMLTISLLGCSTSETSIEAEPTIQSEQVASTSSEVPLTGVETSIHFIDTGQSDCILIEDNNEFMLIDTGDRDDDGTIVNYLNKVGVESLKYLVITHYHADHIGGSDTVTKTFANDDTIVFVPNGSAETKVYKDFINACMEKKLALLENIEDIVQKYSHFRLKGLLRVTE